jgi:hypothetical protein
MLLLNPKTHRSFQKQNLNYWYSLKTRKQSEEEKHEINKEKHEVQNE